MQRGEISDEYLLLLKRLATFPSIDIEYELLKDILNVKKGRLNFLVNRGWLIANENGYKLHQIIKEYILAFHLPTFEEIEVVVDILGKVIANSADIEVALKVKEFLLYFESLNEVLNRQNIESEKVAILWGNLANVYRFLGFYDKAEPLYQKSLAIREKLLGEEHPDTATSYNNLALFYYDTDTNIEMAYEYIKKAIEIIERVLPKNHPNLITAKENLKKIQQEKRGQKRGSGTF